MTDYTIPMIIGMTLAFALGAGLGGLWGLSRHEWLYCRVTAHLTWRMREAMKSLGIQGKSITVDYEVGDRVSVIAGIWKNTVGVVQKMDYNKQSATINVDVFGRETPVEIGFAEIRRFS